MEDGGRLATMAADLVDRMATLVAVRCFHGMGAAASRSLLYDRYIRMQHFFRRTTSIPFRRVLGDVRREFMQHLYAAMGSYLRDALHDGSVDGVACLRVPRAYVFPLPLSFFLLGGLH
jgi:hypothetical protein